MSLTTIHLHGALGEEFGETHRMAVETASEAVRALQCNFPGFVQKFAEGEYEIVRGDYDPEAGMWLDVEQAISFRLGSADLHIVPVIAGSKMSQGAGGALKLVAGVALIAGAAALTGGFGLLGTGMLSGFGATLAGNAAMVGVGLAVAGIATLLAPKQQNPYEQNSFTLSGPGNSYDQGNPVALIYGEVITGSVMVSGAMDIEDIPVNYDPTNGNTSIDTFDPETGQGVVSGSPTSYTGQSGNT